MVLNREARRYSKLSGTEQNGNALVTYAAMKNQTTTIFVYLLNEGTDVWRPVEAQHLGEDRYRILSKNVDPEDEAWQFPSGAVVRCRQQKLSKGDRLVAFEVALATR